MQSPDICRSEALEIPIFLNGDRNYVQASQIISRTAEIMERQQPSEFQLQDFAFKRITANKIAVSFHPTHANSGTNLIGHANFSSSTQPIVAHFHDLGAPAENKSLPEQIKLKLRSSQRIGCGNFFFQDAFSFEDALIVVVQSIKKLHLSLADDAHDIFITAMRGAKLSLNRTFSASSGEINIDMLRLMNNCPQFQTLSRVTITAGRKRMTPFVVMFAFRSNANIHVD
jgi:hypothetical protein